MDLHTKKARLLIFVLILAGLAIGLIAAKAIDPSSSGITSLFPEQNILAYDETATDSPNTTTISEYDTGEYYLEPSQAWMDQADSITITSYVQTETGAVVVNSDWQIYSEDDGIDARACTNGGVSKNCTVYSGDKKTTITFRATHDEEEATTNIYVSNKLAQDPVLSEIPDWAKSAVAVLKKRNIMRGYEDGTFGPSNNLNGYELVLLLYRLSDQINLDTESLLANRNCDLLEDVGPDHYFYQPYCFAYHYDWFKKINNFKPFEAISRQEVAQIIDNAFGRAILNGQRTDIGTNISDQSLLQIFSGSFSDVNQSSPYHEAIILTTISGIMQGSTEGNFVYTFRPTDNLNRAEAAVIVWRLIKELGRLERLEII